MSSHSFFWQLSTCAIYALIKGEADPPIFFSLARIGALPKVGGRCVAPDLDLETNTRHTAPRQHPSISIPQSFLDSDSAIAHWQSHQLLRLIRPRASDSPVCLLPALPSTRLGRATAFIDPSSHHHHPIPYPDRLPAITTLSPHNSRRNGLSFWDTHLGRWFRPARFNSCTAWRAVWSDRASPGLHLRQPRQRRKKHAANWGCDQFVWRRASERKPVCEPWQYRHHDHALDCQQADRRGFVW